MNAQSFADLDELVLRCADRKARQYISEAVAAYRSGALRAAIISTWIAIAFDFIDKVRQLELQGDAVAVQIGSELTAIQTQQDVAKSLAFERSILDRASKELNFISGSELRDLKRLYEDRHLCAHPTMNEREEIFQPTAEQVRYHIRTAVDAMLSQPATSGKAALTTLIAQVEGTFFPTDTAKAKTVLEGGPLAKARASLVRNFAIVLLKRMLTPKIGRSANLRAAAALNAFKSLHPGSCGEAISEKMSTLIRAVSDDNYAMAIAMTARIDDGVSYLQADIRTRMEQFIAKSDPEPLAMVAEFAAGIPFLLPTLENRLNLLKDGEFVSVTGSARFLLNKPEHRNRAIDVYIRASSFDWANTVATRLIVPLANEMSQAEIECLVKGSFENHQVLGSYQFIGMMQALRKSPSVTEEWWNSLLASVGAATQYAELFFDHQPTTEMTEDELLASYEPEEPESPPEEIPWPNPE